MNSTTNYDDARKAAQDLANQLGREVGLEKAKEYCRTVYRVKHLPSAGKRFGWELRCEVVAPMRGNS